MNSHVLDVTRIPVRIPDLPLTRREVEVLHLLARGYKYAQIAAELEIALDTVKTHCKAIYRKLSAKTGPHAVMVAVAAGLIVPVEEQA